MTASAPHVLVVEDDPLALALLRVTLEMHSLEVATAETGKDALEMWENGRYDLITMDIQMPKMDGLTATREIRKREKERGGHIPIVAVTAFSSLADEEKCLAAGMDAFLPKPLDLGKGMEVIMSLIKSNSSH